MRTSDRSAKPVTLPAIRGEKVLGLFWTMAFAIAWLLTVPPALAQLDVIERTPIPAGLGILIGLVPALAAWVAALRGDQKGFWRAMFRRASPWWLSVAAVVLPTALLGIAYGLSIYRGVGIKVDLGPHLFAFGALWFALAFTEEVGWRGFALPRLAHKYGFWTGSLILGLVWCVWHYPRLLASPYLGTFAEAAPLIGLFSVQIVVSNFILCWLYFRSGRSVLAPTLFHASFNVVATAYFLAATDLIVTGLLSLVALAIAIVDKPSRLLTTDAEPGPATTFR